MATRLLTTEAIALTEKKMDMSLDDIIKLSKTNNGKSKNQRFSNRSKKTSKQDKSMKVRQYMDSRSTLRQGVLAQRRSNFQGNSFPVVPDAVRKSGAASFRNGGFNRNRPVILNRPRAAGMQRQRGDALAGGKAFKQQQQQQQQQKQQQQPSQRGEVTSNQKPKTLDSLFANMKEQRMRATHTNNGGAVRGAVNQQPRQPWLRGRFGNYRR